MVDYVKLAATSQRLLDANGRSVTLVYRGPAADSGNAWDGSKSVGGASESAIGVFLDYQRREVDGTKIQAHDKRLLVAAQNLTNSPTTAERVTDGGVNYQVIDVRVVQPGATILLYELQVRA